MGLPALNLPPIRIGLYLVLTLFSFILFCLCAARLHYTNNLVIGDPLNGGRGFYDPVIVELLVATLLTMPWSLYVAYSIHKRLEYKYIGNFLAEIIVLAVLWLFWVAGAAVAAEWWGNLQYCQQFEPCRVLSALVAFAWLGWVALTLIAILSLMFTIANKSWKEPLHGRWDPRASHFVPGA